MFTITKSFRFEAAHVLPKHAGKCARLHGHSFVGRLVLRGESLRSGGSEDGMLQDFGAVSAAVGSVLDSHLDHRFLNDTLPMESPTSEAVARWLYERLKPELPMLAAVEVDETCTSSARYEP